MSNGIPVSLVTVWDTASWRVRYTRDHDSESLRVKWGTNNGDMYATDGLRCGLHSTVRSCFGWLSSRRVCPTSRSGLVSRDGLVANVCAGTTRVCVRSNGTDDGVFLESTRPAASEKDFSYALYPVLVGLPLSTFLGWLESTRSPAFVMDSYLYGRDVVYDAFIPCSMLSSIGIWRATGHWYRYMIPTAAAGGSSSGTSAGSMDEESAVSNHHVTR
jgi:hypothetical protein